MSKADELFEKLGYEKKNLEDKWGRVWGLEYNNEKHYISIDFDLFDKELCIGTLEDNDLNSEPVYIGIAELKAINKKCKELGWLDE